jgi:hypothetical protein
MVVTTLVPSCLPACTSIFPRSRRTGERINASFCANPTAKTVKVKKRTIANLSACSDQEVEAIKLALEHKDNLAELGCIRDDLTLRQGDSVGAVWLVYKMACRLGIAGALGNSRAGKLALWQVIARVINWSLSRKMSQKSGSVLRVVTLLLQWTSQVEQDGGRARPVTRRSTPARGLLLAGGGIEALALA